MNNTKILEKKINKERQTGNVKNAIELCQIGLQEDPTNPDLHIRLGDLYMEWHLDIYNSCQYVDEAITEYQRALESYIDSPEIYFKIGQAHYFKGDLDKAVNYLDMAVSKDNKYAKAYYLLAETYTKRARFLEAAMNAKKAIHCAPLTSSCAHFLLSNLYRVSSFRSFKNWFMSKYEYILSLLTLPFDKQAITNVIRAISYLKFAPVFWRGLVQIQLNQFNEAIETYTEAIEKAPGMVNLYYLLGDLYRAMGRFDDAITEYKMAIWLDSLNIPAYRHLCQAYEELGDYDSAVEVYEKLIKIMPNMPDVHSNLANILYIKGDLQGAISHYQTAITLNPRKQWTSVINQTLGYVYQEAKKDLDAAISSYQSAYLLTPEDIDIYINLGSAFYDKEDVDNALTVYRNALDLDPKNAKIHCNLGFLLWGLGNLTEAIDEYELSIKYQPDYAIAHNNLGVIYLDDLAQIQKASECFKAALEYDPNYALAHYNYARCLSIKGEKVEAAKYYRAALDINAITKEMDSNEIQDRLNSLFE